MYRGQEADLPLLPREGRPQADVSQPVGEAPHDVRAAAGLAAVAGVLATHHPCPGPGDQLGAGAGIAAAPAGRLPRACAAKTSGSCGSC